MSDQARHKILFVIRALNVGGAERQLVELAGGMRRAGWDVTLVTFYSGGSFETLLRSHGVPHVSLQKRGRWDVLPFLWRLLKVIRAERPDVVYSMLTMSNVLIGLLAPLLGRTRIVWGVAASNMDLSYYDWLARVESKLEVSLARRADLIICNSVAGRDYHVARGYPEDTTVVICNGIDTAEFRPDAAARHAIRREWGVEDDERIIALVGRLDPIKDHANFLTAARHVGEARGRVRFACVGDGYPEYRSRLEALATELGIGDRVLWIRERTDVWRVYNALDLVVSASISEGLTNVLAEAMATGVRCAATAVGDSARLIANPRWLAPPSDSRALAAAMLNALDDPAFDAAAARRRIIDELSIDRLVAQTSSHLTPMLAARRVGGLPPSGSGLAPRAEAPTIVMLTRRLDIGGAERQLVELAKGLHAAGWHVIVATFYKGGALASSLRESGVEIVALDKKSRWDVFGFAWRLVALVRRSKPQVLHAYLSTANVLATLLRPFFGRVRIVWGVRSSNMDLRNYDWLAALESRIARTLSRHADLIIANSEAGRAYHAAEGYPAANMVVVPNGVDMDKFAPNGEARVRVREQWGVAPQHVLVGHVARLDPMKDHRNFLKAAAAVAAARPTARFVCVGDGPAAYRDVLHAEARALGLDGKLVWAGARHDMPDVYNALDLLVSPSAYGEGFPNTIVEAMATGVPCVVTDVGDSAAIVGSLGWICPPGNTAALAAAMRTAIETLPCDAARIRAHVAASYSSAILLERTLARLAPLAPRAPPVPRTAAGGTNEY